MYTAYKYRVYPTKDQKVMIQKTFGCVRFIYNHLLNDKNEYYKETGKTLKREVTYYKNQDQYSFLKEVDSLSLANAKINLQNAFKKFFSKETGFPKFHKKGSRESYTTNNVNNSIRFENGKLKLPKVGLLKTKVHRPLEGTIKSVTVSFQSNKYYVSILVEKPDVIIVQSKIKHIGLDYKSNGLYVDSEGNCPQMPHFYRESEKRLAILQRKLSKKKKGSNNYKKMRQKISKLSEHIANQRKDYLHKLSKELTDTYNLIIFEDINLKNISNKKALKLGKSTNDNGFGMFRIFCEYKEKRKGGMTLKINRWFPSTKMCHVCGHIHNLSLSDREWICPNCGTYHDRDINAAINIRNEGLNMLNLGLI